MPTIRRFCSNLVAAAFLATELSGKSLEECVKAGIAAGAEAVTTIGGQPTWR